MHDRGHESRCPAHARAYNSWRYPKRVFNLPPDVKAVVESSSVRKPPAIPDFVPPALTRQTAMPPSSRRTGCIAVKAGMTQTWDENGVRVPLTVLFMDECQVVGIKSEEKHGYWALQMGAGYRKQKMLSPSQAGFFLKQGVPFKHDVAEFRVTPDAVLPVGTRVGAGHFVAGQRVDVAGHTKYKGFAGVMKRWGFAGQPATHGITLSHRAPGAIGNSTDPGRVWKGKKMAGHMGGAHRTMHNCLLYKVDPARNVLYVRGQVPGPAGAFVYVRDAVSAPRAEREEWGLPFPTLVGDASTLPATVYKNPSNPYRPWSVDGADYFPIQWKKGE